MAVNTKVLPELFTETYCENTPPLSINTGYARATIKTKIIYQSCDILKKINSNIILDMTIVQNALELQVRYTLRVPDALQIAFAVEHNASVILTHDKR